MKQRPLGKTGIPVSVLGLGTVKLGRDRGVKYPTRFEIPEDAEARELIELALELGINLVDTAPAYGISEERLGKLLEGLRDRVVLSTKTGEEYDGERSSFDFSAKHTRASVERSLRRLKTDWLDVVLIHSSGEDRAVLEQGALEELVKMREEGWIRAVGISTKTVEGGLRAIERGCDVLMVTYSPAAREEGAVIEAAGKAGCGILLKKALASGHAAGSLEENFRFALAPEAVSSVVVGTIQPRHLRANVATVDSIFSG